MKESPVGVNRRIAVWLFIIALAIYGMVMVGGATRLTGSGLSITEWKPIMGVIPPLNQNEWVKAFELYQQYPQYKISNPDMSLDGFKLIFMWEYLHRLLGRAIGVVLVIGFIYFLISRQMTWRLVRHLIAIIILLGLQGALGWFMVMSGLEDKPWVSPYRLTAHLLLALVLYSYVLNLIFLLWGVERVRAADGQSKTSCCVWRVPLVLLVLLVIQISYGGFVAGSHAALVYPTFPTMNGQWIPNGLFRMSPLWVNFFGNPTTTQFIHRTLAMLLVVAILIYYWRSAGWSKLNLSRKLLVAAVLLQFVLGVLTLINSVGRIPVVLGVLHQGGAVALLSVLWYLIYKTRGLTWREES